MTQWQPGNQPRYRAGQPPATPPQWQRGAPPRQDGDRGRRHEQGERQPYPMQQRIQQPTRQPNPRPYWPVAQLPQQGPQQRPVAHPRPLPRYPRFPRIMPRSRRGPSIFHVVYLGTHPVALLVSLLISLMLVEFWLMAVMIAGIIWLSCCGAVAIQRAAARRR